MKKAFLVIFAIVLGYIVYLYFMSPSTETQPFSHLVTSIEDSSLSNVVYDPSARKVTYQVDGKAFESVVISETQVAQLAAVPMEVVEPPSPLTSKMFLLVMLLTLLIGAVIFVVIIKGISGLMGEALGSVGSKKFRVVKPDENSITMKDVISSPGQHEEVLDIITFIKSRELFDRTDTKIPRGILMQGPPGVGKTLIAQAIAGEAKVTFFEISGSEFVEKYVGVGAKRVRELFEEARKQAPSIIFIDEIDAIGSSRDQSSNSERDQTLNQLLVEMQGFANNKDVFVLGATNRSEVLDPALLRPGRFDRVVSIGLPDVECRKKLAELFMGKYHHFFTAEDVDADEVAKITTGFSPADINNLFNEAAIKSLQQGKVRVDIDLLNETKEKIIMGAESKKSISKDELKRTAYHEAGHAITGFLSPDHDPVHKVSIIPRGNALGVTMFNPDEDRFSNTYESLFGRIVTLYGGRAAEEIKYGQSHVSSGASSDIQRATKIASDMVFKWGLGNNGNAHANYDTLSRISDTSIDKLNDDVYRILEQAYDKAMEILKNNDDRLEQMTDLLMEKETIDAKDVQGIMGI